MKLIQGKIYYQESCGYKYIFKHKETNRSDVIGSSFININFNRWENKRFVNPLAGIKEATEEQEQWFLACEKANKFIPQEEALKSFKQETKFIEGKWYKINNCWWAKFQTIHGSGVYWRYSEAIPQSKIYIDLPHNVLDWKDVSIELLTDLSEIQAYLPEGHVDKIKKEEPVDLLAEARKRFPVGSKFKCPNGNKSHYEANYNKEDDTWTVTTYKIIRIEGQDCVHSGNGYLHFKGKWAIIISEAKQPEEEKWTDYNLTSEQILNLHNQPIDYKSNITLGYRVGIDPYEKQIKKSKVQQVEVVPLQKPCIISTRKSKLNLIKL